MVNWVVSQDSMMDKAYSVAGQAASKSPYSVSRLKRLLTRGISGDLDHALELEEEVTVAAFKTDEAKERSKNFPTRK